MSPYRRKTTRAEYSRGSAIPIFLLIRVRCFRHVCTRAFVRECAVAEFARERGLELWLMMLLVDRRTRLEGYCLLWLCSLRVIHALEKGLFSLLGRLIGKLCCNRFPTSGPV